MLPGFIIIGGMKCGTTSLNQYLDLHPQIGMAKIKETDFFIKESNYSKGINWYKSLFDENVNLSGEASPNYSKAHFSGGVPKRIYNLLPDVKLIYLVRDPVDRILSHYTHNYAAGREPLNIEKAFHNENKYNHYLKSSWYYWQLTHYLVFFPKEQIMIINSSDLKINRKETLEQVFKFLGVDSFYTQKYDNQFGVTTNRVNQGSITRKIVDNPVTNSFKTYMSVKIKQKVKKTILPRLKKFPKPSPLLIKKLKTDLKPDVEELRNFTGKKFSDWDI